MLRELDQGKGFGFAHFNNGECHCLIQGTHTNRDGIEICPEHVRLLLEDCIARLPIPGFARGFWWAFPVLVAVGFA